ncbi:MAG: hypothetical protein ACRDBI_05730 [Shewanella sp.]
MKLLTVSVILATMFSATAGAENWSSEARDDGQTQFYVNLQGEVPKRCRMVTTDNLTINMDLKGGKESQFKFKAWCNVDSSKGTLVVGASPFINKNGNDIIPLMVDFNGTTGAINKTTHAGSATNYHAIETAIDVSNATTIGAMGDTKVLKIKPEVNGWEKSGTYTTAMYVSLYPQ